MGKCKDPKVIWVDDCFVPSPEIDELVAKGHSINWINTDGIDLLISPKAQMTPIGRLGYVVKKLKDIVKEVSSK